MLRGETDPVIVLILCAEEVLERPWGNRPFHLGWVS